MNSIIPQWTREWAESRAIPFVFFPQTESSHLEAQRLAPQALSRSLLLIAQRQSHGRGRRGRVWHESDLMASWLYKALPRSATLLRGGAPPRAPLFASGDFSNLSLDFAKDLQAALQSVFPALNLRLKAPNDLFCGEKKIAGLLVEIIPSAESKAAIVSLGLNVFSAPSQFPQAGSLMAALTGGPAADAPAPRAASERQAAAPWRSEAAKKLSFSNWMRFLDRLHKLYRRRFQQRFYIKPGFGA